MKKIAVLTGAGMSVESGLSTFRGGNGMWDNYPVEAVASIDGYRANPALVLEFYNKRRVQLLDVVPNEGHKLLAGLEKEYDVTIITQNVDDLHERAGSKRVTHLHGELMKLRSERNSELIVPIEGWEQTLDARAEDGALLRPHIVFFGESVPMFDAATHIAAEADLMIVVGTSLAVYPAAMLVRYAKSGVPIYVVDPGTPDTSLIRNNPLTHIKARAAEGMPELAERLKAELK